MTFSIGAIVWPIDSKAALDLYLRFLVRVIEGLNINFRNQINDPVYLTKAFLEGNLSDEERCAAVSAWWDYLDRQGAIRDFQSRDALMARLAICLLGIKEEDASELGENLSWFLEVLGFLGVNLNGIIGEMMDYFPTENVRR